MNRTLPENASLEHLRSQAKTLHKSLAALDSDALARAAELGLAAPFRLAAAQLIVAREYGFDSWPKLKRQVEDYPNRVGAFFAAIRSGDRERVAELVAQDNRLIGSHDPNNFGASVIVAAVNRSDRPMIDLLLKLGADIDARSDWWAGSFGALDSADESMSSYLLSRGATLTPHAAARLGMEDALRSMIAEDPSVVDRRGGDGQFPLHFAKSPEIVDLLIDAGADPDARDMDHNSTAAQWRIRDIPVCRRLVERGATADLFIAASLDDAALVDRVLDADPGAIDERANVPRAPMTETAPGGNIYLYVIGDRYWPHFLAWDRGSTAAWTRLLERSTESKRLAATCWTQDPTRVAALPGRIEGLDQTALGVAAWNGRAEAVRMMLERGCEVDYDGGSGSTPINSAAFHGFSEVIAILLAAGPDLALRNPYGGTPLGACIYGSIHGWRTDGDYPRSVEMLLEAGSPKPKAARGSEPVNAVLVRYGIDVS